MLFPYKRMRALVLFVLALACVVHVTLSAGTSNAPYVPPSVTPVVQINRYAPIPPTLQVPAQRVVTTVMAGPPYTSPVAYALTGNIKCDYRAIRCKAILIGPGGSGYLQNGMIGCGGGGSVVTDVDLAPGLSYVYNISPPQHPIRNAGDTSATSLYNAQQSQLLSAYAGTPSGTGTGQDGKGGVVYLYANAPSLTPGLHYLGGAGSPVAAFDVFNPCKGGDSWSTGLGLAEANITYSDASNATPRQSTAYPWGAGGSGTSYGAQGAIILTTFFA
jgi:hypothetical protein